MWGKTWKGWIMAAVALGLIIAPQTASAAKVQPDIAYVGWYTVDQQTHGWVVRATGVNSSWAAVTQVTYYLADGTSVALEPKTARFNSGAGSDQWSTQQFTTVVPAGATELSARIQLIEMKKPEIVRDEVISQVRPLQGQGNLYCNPLFYSQCS